MLFAQADTAVDLIHTANLQGGWLAGLLVLIILAALGLFGFLIRGDRSELREINRFVRTEMPEVIDGNTVMISRFVAVLHDVPCVHDSDLDKIVATDPRKMGDAEISELDAVARKAAERIKRRAIRRTAKQQQEPSSDE